MQLALWKFRVKSNQTPWLPSPIHPAAREDAVPASPSPSSTHIWQGQQSPALKKGLGPVLDALGTWNQETKPAGPPAHGSLCSVTVQSQLTSCSTASQSLPWLHTVLPFQFYVISTVLPLIKCDCTNLCDQGWPGKRDISCLLGRAFKSKPAVSHAQRREGRSGAPVCLQNAASKVSPHCTG